MALKESPSQTAGPYVQIGCTPEVAGLEQRQMGAPMRGAMPAAGAKVIRLSLEIFDGAGAPVKDAMVEIWQTGPSDGQRHWVRQAVDFGTGVATFDTVKPGRNGQHAPHILVWIVARGINLGLTSRVYFPDEDNAADPVFALAGARAGTLTATQTDGGYSHHIYLQGPNETVFFDV